MSEINSVAEAVPLIMQARGYDEVPSCGTDSCFMRDTPYSCKNWNEATAECCSLDVLAKEVWAKFPLNPIYIYKDEVDVFYCDKDGNTQGNCQEKGNVFEAACIATARALVALAAATGSQEK